MEWMCVIGWGFERLDLAWDKVDSGVLQAVVAMGERGERTVVYSRGTLLMYVGLWRDIRSTRFPLACVYFS